MNERALAWLDGWDALWVYDAWRDEVRRLALVCPPCCVLGASCVYKIDIWSSHNVKGEGELMKRDETLRVEGYGMDGMADTTSIFSCQRS